MKLCLMCDLHLPKIMSALQYDALEWAIDDALRKKADCIIVAGDITCDGNFTVYNTFVKKMSGLSVPVLYIPGNSDLRDKSSADIIKQMSSPCKTQIGDTTVFALNDCDRNVARQDLDLLETADENSIVFMHHPIHLHSENARAALENFVKDHNKTMLFYGHKHISFEDANTVSLQALDPDKAIGEYPCVAYYDTDTRTFRKSYYFAPVPADFYDNIGISCYRPKKDIELAISRGIKNLELRKNILKENETELKDLIARWRTGGGQSLCVHLTDVGYEDGAVVAGQEYAELISLAKRLGADRLTHHVARVSVNTVKNDPVALERIAEYIATSVDSVGHPFVIGVENIHTTSSDDVTTDRRFGYTPEECFEFMQILASKTNCKVGINFDIGHARNNAPFSQTYQVGTWLTMLGPHIVGYHFHQVIKGENGFENHFPVSTLHGGIINYTSFFKNWLCGNINKVPVIFEMRPENAYNISLDTFNKYNNRVFDLHSHTYYSRCGKDSPEKLAQTAIENGISVLGISDHAHGIGDKLDMYLWQMKSVAQKYSEKIRIICGIEIATNKKNFDPTITEKIKQFDYCLIEHITDPESCVGKNLIEFCKKAAIPCGIAHTDLFEFCSMYGYDPEEYLKALADNGIFWEMNVSYDSIHKYNEHKYVKNFMSDDKKIEIVKNSGIKISIGFDSHRCDEYYAPAVYDMYDFLKRNGINMVI